MWTAKQRSEQISTYTTDLARLASDEAVLSRPVPACPEWDVADLAWHLCEVQDFWNFIITSRPADYEGYVQPPRPEAPSLAGHLRDGVARLTASLLEAEPTDQAWSWSTDQTVGFTLRRQAHEALVHCIDGYLAVGHDLPDVPAELASDGIDEVLMVMLRGSSDNAGFVANGQQVSLNATDTGRAWSVQLGTLEGRGAVQMLADDASTAASISGSSIALDLWLWGRDDSANLGVTGEPAAAAALRSLLAEST